jgi:ATP-dependent RNA helicase DOB1
VDGDGVVQLKGHVACEISTSDEIVTTELIFSGALKGLSVDQVGAYIFRRL